MPSKWKRYKTSCCGRKVVTWKVIKFSSDNGSHKIYLCWHCAEMLVKGLTNFNFKEGPIKKKILAGKKIVPVAKPHKQETF